MKTCIADWNQEDARGLMGGGSDPVSATTQNSGDSQAVGIANRTFSLHRGFPHLSMLFFRWSVNAPYVGSGDSTLWPDHVRTTQF